MVCALAAELTASATARRMEAMTRFISSAPYPRSLAPF
jgi:hypothetical protein